MGTWRGQPADTQMDVVAPPRVEPPILDPYDPRYSPGTGNTRPWASAHLFRQRAFVQVTHVDTALLRLPATTKPGLVMSHFEGTQ